MADQPISERAKELAAEMLGEPPPYPSGLDIAIRESLADKFQATLDAERADAVADAERQRDWYKLLAVNFERGNIKVIASSDPDTDLGVACFLDGVWDEDDAPWPIGIDDDGLPVETEALRAKLEELL